MVAIDVFDNISQPLAWVIRERFLSAQSASIAVAFVRQSGLHVLEKPLLRFLERGGVAECIFGFDYMFTEPRALAQMSEWARSHSGFRFFAYSTSVADDGGSYHPKLYILREPDLTHVIVGSSNLTRGGLRSNLEANVLISGGRDDGPIVQGETLYRYVRNRETVFAPNPQYLEAYSELYEAYRTARRRVSNEAATVRLRAELERCEASLPGTVPTQKDLVVQGIRQLTTGREEFVSLRNITAWVEAEARRRGMHFKWETLPDSVRGRLNEHTVGKGGEDLFERMGGVSGRFGRYRLTERGERLKMRRTLEGLT